MLIFSRRISGARLHALITANNCMRGFNDIANTIIETEGGTAGAANGYGNVDPASKFEQKTTTAFPHDHGKTLTSATHTNFVKERNVMPLEGPKQFLRRTDRLEASDIDPRGKTYSQVIDSIAMDLQKLLKTGPLDDLAVESVMNPWLQWLDNRFLCSMLRKIHDPHLAMALFNWSIKHQWFSPRVFAYSQLIKILASAKMFDSVERILEEMKKNGALPNEVTYRIIIEAYENDQKGLRGEAIVRSFEEWGGQFTSSTYGSLILMNSKLERHDRVIDLYHEMKSKAIKPSDVTAGILITAFGKMKNVQLAEEVFRQVEASGKVPNIIHWSSMLSVYGKVDRLSEGLAFFQEMRRKGVEPNPITWTILLSFCQRESDMLRSVKRIILEEPYLQTEVYVYLLRVLMDTFLDEDTVEVAERIEELGLPFSANVYGSLIRLYSRVGQKRRAVELYKQMIKRGISPRVWTIELYSQIRQDVKSEPPEGSNASSTDSRWSTMISNYCKSGMHVEAMDALEKLLSSDSELKKNIPWLQLLLMCRNRALPGVAEQVAEKMMAIGLEPTKAQWNTLMESLALGGDHQRAMRWFNRMAGSVKRMDAATFLLTMEVLLRNKALEEVSVLLYRMPSVGVEQDASVYVTLFGGYATVCGGDEEGALFIRGLMERCKLRMHADLFQILDGGGAGCDVAVLRTIFQSTLFWAGHVRWKFLNYFLDTLYARGMSDVALKAWREAKRNTSFLSRIAKTSKVDGRDVWRLKLFRDNIEASTLVPLLELRDLRESIFANLDQEMADEYVFVTRDGTAGTSSGKMAEVMNELSRDLGLPLKAVDGTVGCYSIPGNALKQWIISDEANDLMKGC